jgi:hypothetical protein
MLQNRIYRGEITHKENAYPGEHQPIVDNTLWEEVQAVLSENRDWRSKYRSTGPTSESCLAFNTPGARFDRSSVAPRTGIPELRASP